MDQKGDDPNRLDGESSKSAGSVFYGIRYFSLTERPGSNHIRAPFFSKKKKKKGSRCYMKKEPTLSITEPRLHSAGRLL